MHKIALLFSLALAISYEAHAQSSAPTTATSTSAQPSALSSESSDKEKASASKPTLVLPPEKAKAVPIPHFEKPPVIDGQLDDEVWKGAAVFKDFYQINPGDNIAPSHPTELMIGYDSKFLYFAFHAFDDPSKVRATVARRDNVFGEDNVRIFLDTFNDQRKAYVLGFNPFGVQQDGILTEGGGTDFSVDIVMESKGVITKDGYIVEVAVPFKSLRYEAGKGKFWGFHAWRNIDRFNDEMDSWMPISRDRTGTMNQAGRITGLEGISTERTIELIPSLTLSETGKRVRSIPPDVLRRTPGLIDEGRFVNEPVDIDPGLTAKFGISPTLTLDLALNPDFAQVEADQLVVTTNQRFPIFFPERRPFFLEGIEIFQTPLTAVHTRAIVDPDVAVKLTGRRGRNTFGLMVASDNGPGNFVGDERLDARNQRFLDKNAHIGVVRLKRDIGREHSLGLIATTYNFIERHNDLGGFDGRFRINKQTTLNFQVLGTTSRGFFFDPELGRRTYRTGNGLGYSFNYSNAGRNYVYEVFGEGLTRDYRAQVGFTSRTNTNFNGLFLGYNSDPKPKARLISWHVHNFSHIDYDFQGRMQIWESEFNAQWSFKHNTFLSLAYEYAYERLFEEEFGPVRTPTRAGTFAGNDSERSSTKNHFFLSGGSRISKKYAFDFRAVYRDGHFDFDFGAGRKYPRVSPGALLSANAPLDPGPGGLFEFRGSFAYQPTNELNMTLNYTKNRLVRYDTDRVAFDVNLISWRTTYQFTRFLFARARVDYETLPSRARGQFLLGWTPNPGTSFYVGYNDDVNYGGFSPINGRLEPGFRRNGRTFFIKMSYLFRRSIS